MARSSYQKLKPLYIMNYLLQNSDEEHPVTIKQIVEYLGAQGISAERKSIYDDIMAWISSMWMPAGSRATMLHSGISSYLS